MLSPPSCAERPAPGAADRPSRITSTTRIARAARARGRSRADGSELAVGDGASARSTTDQARDAVGTTDSCTRPGRDRFARHAGVDHAAGLVLHKIERRRRASSASRRPVAPHRSASRHDGVGPTGWRPTRTARPPTACAGSPARCVVDDGHVVCTAAGRPADGARRGRCTHGRRRRSRARPPSRIGTARPAARRQAAGEPGGMCCVMTMAGRSAGRR